MGFALVNRFTDLFTTRLGTTNKYSANANLHTVQFITAQNLVLSVCY
jgi:hypothetical protein